MQRANCDHTTATSVVAWIATTAFLGRFIRLYFQYFRFDCQVKRVIMRFVTRRSKVELKSRLKLLRLDSEACFEKK